MRLAFKLLVSLVVLFSLALVVSAWAQRRFLETEFERRVAADTELLVRSARTSVELAWRHDGRAEAERLVVELDRDEASDAGLRLIALGEGAARGDAASTRAITVLRVGEGDAGELLFTVPLSVPAPGRFALEVRRPLRGELSVLDESLRWFGRTTASAIALAVLIAGALGGRLITMPIHAFAVKARAVGGGDYTPTFDEGGRDELGELGAALNTMVAQLSAARSKVADETEQRIKALALARRNDRLGTVGTLAAGIAHELGTPLHVIAGRARRIANAEGVTAQIRDDATVVREQVDRVQTLVRRLLSYARAPESEPSLTRLDLLAVRLRELLAPIAQKRDVTIALGPLDELSAMVRTEHVEQALTNLIVNAIDASPGRTVTLSLGRQRRDAGQGPLDWAVACVDDEGSGIDDDAMPRLFDPFFSTKPVNEGTGLGLFIVHGLAREHGGFVEAENRPQGGARFSLWLPLATEVA